jgi:glutamate-1-semialdehyde 2,1-aminomutase
MDCIAPVGDVYQAGTLSGNPLATVAGLTMLKLLTESVYQDIAQATDYLCEGLEVRAAAAGQTVRINSVCGMFGLFFTGGEVTEFDHVANADVDRFNRFFHAMLEAGVYLAPSAFEAGFVSTAHSREVVDATLDAAEIAFAGLD